MSSLTKVIIVGAGGHLGRSLISAFNAEPHFQVSILTRRRPSDSEDSNFPSNIPVHRVGDNYDDDESQLVEILTGQDVVVSAIAAQAVGQQKTIIDAAVKACVKHFVPSEFGPDTRNQRAAELLPTFLCKAKREIVEYLRSKESADPGMKWTAFVPGLIFEMAVFSYLGYDINHKQATILNNGSQHWSTTTLNTVALAVKNAMLAPAKTSNKYLFIESFNTSQKDVLAALEELTKTAWDVSYHDAEEDKRLALDKLSKGDYSGIPVLLRYIACTEGYGGDYMKYEEGANQLLSLPKESLAGALGRMVGGQRKM